MKRELTIIVLCAFFIGCAWAKETLYPQLKPTCEEACEHLFTMGCTDTYGSPAVGGPVDINLCKLACDAVFGATRGQDFKRCLNEARTCDEVEACKRFYPEEDA